MRGAPADRTPRTRVWRSQFASPLPPSTCCATSCSIARRATMPAISAADGSGTVPSSGRGGCTSISRWNPPSASVISMVTFRLIRPSFPVP
ncbi:MAG: hypothetical protein ACK55Z_36275, partial [bacterium]